MSAPPVSRIPRLVVVNRTPSAPSKLELLREQFHQRRMREKEDLLLEMFHERQTAIMRRMNATRFDGTLRTTQQGSSHRANMAGQRRAGQLVDYNGRALANYSKDSTGRDKSTPLAPIKRPANTRLAAVSTGPRIPYPPAQNQKSRQHKVFLRHHSNPIIPTQQQTNNNNRNNVSNGNSPSDGRIESLRLGSGESGNNQSVGSANCDGDAKAMTPFQKWQLQQDLEKEARLKKCKDKHNSSAQSRHSEQESSGDLIKPPACVESGSRNGARRTQSRISSRQTSVYSCAQNEDDDRSATDSHRDAALNGIKEQEEKLMALIKKEQATLEIMKMQREENELDEDGRMVVSHNERRSRLRAASRRADSLTRDTSCVSVASDVSQLTRRRLSSNSSPPPSKTPLKKYAPPPPPPSKRPPYKVPEKDTERAAFYAEKASADDAQGVAVDMTSCDICGRNFAVDRLTKHMAVCAKVSAKKRKVFDQVKMRTQGTDQASYVRHMDSQPQKAPTTNWRRKHEDFVQSLRHARHASQMIAEGRTPPPAPPSHNPDYVQCEHCGRRFNQAASERHIPLCRNLKSRPRPPGAARQRR